MIDELDFENYRGFQHFGLSELRRINLLVGKNNCGKTSILEGIHLLVTGGDPIVLARNASQRGERIFAPESRDRYNSESSLDVSHFFYGHDFQIGTGFSISAEPLGQLYVRVVSASEGSEQGRLFEEGRPDLILESQYLSVYGDREIAIPVFEDGALSSDAFRPNRHLRRDREPSPAVELVSPYSLEPRSLGAMWNRIVVEARESEVVSALQIIEPRLNGIFFLTAERAARVRDTIVAAFEGERRRVPLGSHGDGMRRLLEISLSLAQTSDGFLLIDEIDTGFHYSIMGEMWRLVATAALEKNIHVFATTHSLDCIRGLAWLCENYPHLGAEVSMQKIDRSLNRAVALDAEQIMIAANQNVETR
ncbi:MAG TPA: AAA family ATPase [Pirellulales bacterium]|jgi:hypothetical protein